MRRKSDDFGKRVRQVLAQHGPEEGTPLTYRAADRQSGVNYVTISNMAQGSIPEMESVVRWAAGFDLDVAEWLELAGYPPIGDAFEKIVRALERIPQDRRDGTRVTVARILWGLASPQNMDELVADLLESQDEPADARPKPSPPKRPKRGGSAGSAGGSGDDPDEPNGIAEVLGGIVSSLA